MIANKHTELRIYSNLNSLLQTALDEKEYKTKIKRHIFQYMRDYIDKESYNKGIYDIFDDLSSNYQKHAWNIADKIKEEILEEKSSTNYLDPKVYTKEFKETLTEELTDKVLEKYFKEFNNQISMYESKNKVDSLRKKDNKNILNNNIDKVKEIISDTIELDYNICLRDHEYNHELILDNFESVRTIRSALIEDSINNIYNELGEKFKKEEIERLVKSELSLFIKEKKAVLGLNKKKEKDTLGDIIKHPKLARAVIISKMWKDITK